MRFFSIYIILILAAVNSCFSQESEVAVKLGPAINSEYAERMPLISLDGKALYFARKSHPQNMGSEDKDDIWVSYLNPKTGQWTTAANVGAPLNNDGHNFVVSINTSGDAMYLANDYHQNLKDAISYTVKKGRKWSTPFTLEIPDYKNKSLYVNYHVSRDEKYLLIAAQENQTQGGRDLYVCFKTKQGWSTPLNLGKDINSSAEENSVFLAADNKTIYFSSEGHQGMGGYDLFMSKRLDDSWTKWSKPVNLGPSINTSSNDLSISIPASGDYAYIARGPIDNTDIYKIKIPQAVKPSPVTFIQAQLVDAETKKPIDGRIYFESLDENRSEEESIFRGREAKYIVESEQDMGIYAQVKGYFPASDHYTREGDDYESVDGDNDAYYQNSELQVLQNRLDDLQRELKKLQQKKEISKRGKNYKNSALAKNTKQSARNNAGTFKDVGDEDELGDLKSKYQRHYDDTDTLAEKKLAISKETDSDALKEAREKYQQYYDQGEEATKTSTGETKNSPEKTSAYVASIIKGMFSDFYPTIVREVKKEEEINLSSKDIIRLEELVKLDIYDEWTSIVARQLKTKYKNKLEKETKILIKQDLKDEFADNLRTDISLMVKRQKEKNIQQNITKQLASPTKKITAPKKAVKTVKAPTYQQVEKELNLIPLKKGAVLTLNNIFFEMNKATLKSQSTNELNRIFEFLEENPQLSIEIGGHANGWCSPEFASELSKDRAETVHRFLVQEGLDKKRLSYKGYGKSDPIASNDTAAGRKQNQRVELKIIDIIE